jgi:hypothetical protein
MRRGAVGQKYKASWTSKDNQNHIVSWVIPIVFPKITSRGSAVCVATGYGLDVRKVGVQVSVVSIIFTSHIFQVASISQLTVSRLSRQCGILNISQLYRHPRPVAGIALLYGDGVRFL